jgi:tetratricopeptide (TPR) repeat protein
MPSLVHEAYPPHLLAQKLNNRAAVCIEVGDYEQAVSQLIKAFKISEQLDNTTSCQCQRCSLDACMTYSQEISQHRDPGSNEYYTSLPIDDSKQDRFIYRQPIHVTPESIQDCHSGGLTLLLILTFNLALAHHLSANEESQLNRPKLQKVLKLYEIAYRWQMEQDNEQVDSVRFSMIISNNLGETHRAANNQHKHVLCLQHLLSTMMFMVDCHQKVEPFEFDGFIRNTSQLILNGHCAGAA